GFALALRASGATRPCSNPLPRVGRTLQVRTLALTILTENPPCGGLSVSWLGDQDYSGFALALRASGATRPCSNPLPRVGRTLQVRTLALTILTENPPCGGLSVSWLGDQDSNLG